MDIIVFFCRSWYCGRQLPLWPGNLCEDGEDDEGGSGESWAEGSLHVPADSLSHSWLQDGGFPWSTRVPFQYVHTHTLDNFSMCQKIEHIERSQLRWFNIWWGDLGADPGHAGGIISLGWPGNASGFPPEELVEVAGERAVWASLLRLLPPRPRPGWSGWRRVRVLFHLISYSICHIADLFRGMEFLVYTKEQHASGRFHAGRQYSSFWQQLRQGVTVVQVHEHGHRCRNYILWDPKLILCGFHQQVLDAGESSDNPAAVNTKQCLGP